MFRFFFTYFKDYGQANTACFSTEKKQKLKQWGWQIQNTHTHTQAHKKAAENTEKCIDATAADHLCAGAPLGIPCHLYVRAKLVNVSRLCDSWTEPEILLRGFGANSAFCMCSSARRQHQPTRPNGSVQILTTSLPFNPCSSSPHPCTWPGETRYSVTEELWIATVCLLVFCSFLLFWTIVKLHYYNFRI